MLEYKLEHKLRIFPGFSHLKDLVKNDVNRTKKIKNKRYSESRDKMQVNIYQVDAFTSQPFHGNPAAVCLLQEPVESEWAQKVAMEMNLSETAFLYKEGDKYNLRWFTPKVEVDLCGHATLASAHILWEEKYLKPEEQAVFSTRSGILLAELTQDWIKLDFPVKRITETVPPPGLLRALGVQAKFVKFIGVNKFDYLVEVEGEDLVRNLAPDIAGLSKLPLRAVIITSRADQSGYDFISRFFAPGSGIAEDPVTGSAHCLLGPYWLAKLKRDTFKAYQASPRGGELQVKVQGERVHLYGQAVTVLRGQLNY